MAEGGRVSAGLVGSPSLEEHLSKFPRHLLDRPCVEAHLGKLIHMINTEAMLLLSPDLGLTDVEVEDIREIWPRNPPKQRLAMFKKWQQKNPSQATYRFLIAVFYQAQRIDLVDYLQGMIVSPTTSPQPLPADHPKLDWYSGYLKERHTQLHTTAVSNKWLPAPTQKIFNLAIIKKEKIERGHIDDDFVRHTIRGQVDDILLMKSPIELGKLFDNIEGERKVILIDGAPGSGKSTLSVHICQRWKRGELFQEFSVVILVQLRDPAVQSSQSIADLIPSRSKEMSQQVASAISEVDGRGILWIMDGWDELPLHLRERSLLRDMIAPSIHSPITQSSVIVTSRPVASGELSELVSSRIEVLGFTREEQRQYFTECLKGDTKAVDTLMERLSENQAMEGSCYLPLNASIVAHLYLSDGSLPRTVHGIFSSLVQHCLSHYLCQRLGKTQEEARLTSLDILPQELRAPFKRLCELAFTGISQNKVTFSQSDLEPVKDSAVICEVGLLQATPSVLSDGRTVYYNFLHLSIQEMLSAFHISRMSAGEQISTFDSLFSDSRFSAVFQFYAAITKLRTSRPLLSRLPHWLCPVPAGVLELIKKIIKKHKSDEKLFLSEPKPILVSLLNCVYEVQDPSLCQFVARQLGSRLNLSHTSLSPVDSLAIGYFLSSVPLTSNVKEFRVDLINCSLGDAGTKSLMQSICRSVDPHSTVNTYQNMDLRRNKIHEEGASHIAELLNSTSIVSKLCLLGNPIRDSGLQTIFDALKQNKTLKLLNVSDCRITDTGVASLANALRTNSTLEQLIISDMFNESITENGLTCLVDALSRHSGMMRLWLPHRLKVSKVRKTINEERRRNGLRDMEVL